MTGTLHSAARTSFIKQKAGGKILAFYLTDGFFTREEGFFVMEVK